MIQTDGAGPNLNLLRTLVVVLEERSVTRAAVRLRLTQPAVSRSLQQLRELLSDPLLVRSGRGLALTDRADLLLSDARVALSQATGVLQPRAKFDPAVARGTVRIATSDHVEVALLPAFGKLIWQWAPGLRIQVLPVEPTIEAVSSEEVDVAIGVFDSLPAHLRREPLFEERFVCALRPGQAKRKQLGLRAYLERDHVLVAPRGATRGVIDDELARLGHTRRIARIVPHFLVAALMVSQSDFCATLPKSVAGALGRAALDIVPPPIRLPPARLSMVWHSRREADPLQQFLRKTLRAAADTRGRNSA